MKNLILCVTTVVLSVWVSNAQNLPAKITSFVNDHYKGWKQTPGTCENRNWALRGDFNGDGKSDYLLRFRSGNSVKNTQLSLLAFLNHAPNYIPANIMDAKYDGDMKRSSFKIMKKGETVQLVGGPVKLRTDAVMTYVCETDNVSVFVLRQGHWQALAVDTP